MEQNLNWTPFGKIVSAFKAWLLSYKYFDWEHLTDDEREILVNFHAHEFEEIVNSEFKEDDPFLKG